MKVRRLAPAIWRFVDVVRIRDHVDLIARSQRFLPVTASQKIQSGVVSDAKQPAFGIADGTRGSKRVQRLDHRILQHVLAVNGRADHARAIAMQLCPLAMQQPFELLPWPVTHSRSADSSRLPACDRLCFI